MQTDFDGQLALFDMESNMCDQFVKHVNNCHTDIPRLTEGMVGAQVRLIPNRNLSSKDYKVIRFLIYKIVFIVWFLYCSHWVSKPEESKADINCVLNHK